MPHANFGSKVNEAVETYDHNSERDCTEITAHAMVSIVATM